MPPDIDPQAVVENPDPSAPPKQEGDSAQDQGDDLDKAVSDALAEFDRTSQPEPKQESKPDPATQGQAGDLNAIRDELESVKRTLAGEQTRKDVSSVVERVRGDSAQFSEKFTEAWIDAHMRDNPKLLSAWEGRHDNPRAFEAAVAVLEANYQKEISSLPDAGATEDKAAVSAAVRGASKKAPDPEDFDAAKVAHMSDSQFEGWVKDQGKKAAS